MVNGARVFCRGACWYPIDPVAFTESEEELRDTLTLVRDAGMNMIGCPEARSTRTAGSSRSATELGIMVWQDAMLAFLDPPDDDALHPAAHRGADRGPLGGGRSSLPERRLRRTGARGAARHVRAVAGRSGRRR